MCAKVLNFNYDQPEEYSQSESAPAAIARNVVSGAGKAAHAIASIPALPGAIDRYLKESLPKGTPREKIYKHVVSPVLGVGGVIPAASDTYGKALNSASEYIQSFFPKDYFKTSGIGEEVFQELLPVVTEAFLTKKVPAKGYELAKHIGKRLGLYGVGRGAAKLTEAAGGGPIMQAAASIGAQGVIKALHPKNITDYFEKIKPEEYTKSRNVKAPFPKENFERIQPTSENQFSIFNRPKVKEVLKESREKSYSQAGYKKSDLSKEVLNDFGKTNQSQLKNTLQGLLEKEHSNEFFQGSKNRKNIESFLNKFRTDKQNLNSSVTKQPKYSNFQLMKDLKSEGVSEVRNERLQKLFPKNNNIILSNGKVNKQELSKLYTDKLDLNTLLDVKKNINELKYTGSGSVHASINTIEAVWQKGIDLAGKEYPKQVASLRLADAIHGLNIKAEDSRPLVEKLATAKNKFQWASRLLTDNTGDMLSHVVKKMPEQGRKYLFDMVDQASRNNKTGTLKAMENLDPYIEKLGLHSILNDMPEKGKFKVVKLN